MAYLSSTEASSVANPPRVIVSRFAGAEATTAAKVSALSTGIPADGGASPYRTQGISVWAYASSHGTASLVDDDFFTDAYKLGMRAGDVVIGTHWTTLGSTPLISLGVIDYVSTAGAGIPSTNSMITSTFA